MAEYTPPTNDEMKALLEQWGLHPSEAAIRANVTRRSIDRYCTNPDTLCPYPVLYTLVNQCTGKRIGIDWRDKIIA